MSDYKFQQLKGIFSLQVVGKTPRQRALAELMANGRLPIEALEFFKAHNVGFTPQGQPIWDTDGAAAQAVGGISAIGNGYFDGFAAFQRSVIWNNEGSSGGAGGGIRAWYDKFAWTQEPVLWRENLNGRLYCDLSVVPRDTRGIVYAGIDMSVPAGTKAGDPVEGYMYPVFVGNIIGWINF